MPNYPSVTEFDTTTVFMEGEATIISQECISWDYNGYRPGEPEVPAMHIEFQTADGNLSDEYLTAGSLDDFKPSDDGKCFELVGNKEKFHIKSKLGAFLHSLLEVGFPKKSLNPENYDCLIGTSGHLSTVVLIKAGGRISKDVTAIVFDKITSLPGAGGKKKSGKKTEVDEDVYAKASKVLKSVLSSNPELARKSLMGKAITNDVLKSLPQSDKTKVIACLKTDEFLSTQDGWVFDANVLYHAGDVPPITNEDDLPM